MDKREEKDYLVGMVSFYKDYITRLEKKAREMPYLAQDIGERVFENQEILAYYQKQLREFYINALSSKKN